MFGINDYVSGQVTGLYKSLCLERGDDAEDDDKGKDHGDGDIDDDNGGSEAAPAADGGDDDNK